MMPRETTVNEALIDVAKHTLQRTTWGFADHERQCRDYVMDALKLLRQAENLVELNSKEPRQ